jgi:phage terminase large subunit GpA-like protein
LAITVGCDVQQDRIFAEVLGWGERGETCWMIECHEIPRIRGRNLVELDGLCRKVWQRMGGAGPMGISVLAVDSGKFTDEVYRFAQRWPAGMKLGEGPKRVWAVKGEMGLSWPQPWRQSAVEARADRAASQVGEGLPLLIVNTSYWKEHILARLTGRVDEAAMATMDDWRFPLGVPRGYLMQLTAEQLVRTKRGAKTVPMWVMRPGRTANHFLDCRVYGCAAADKEGVRTLCKPAGKPREASVSRSGASGGASAAGSQGRTSLMQRAAERRGGRG